MNVIGKTIWYSRAHGYGFIRVLDKRITDAFVHYSDIFDPPNIFSALKKGQLVKFRVYITRQGPVAKEVRKI